GMGPGHNTAAASFSGHGTIEFVWDDVRHGLGNEDIYGRLDLEIVLPTPSAPTRLAAGLAAKPPVTLQPAEELLISTVPAGVPAIGVTGLCVLGLGLCWLGLRRLHRAHFSGFERSPR